jgi:cytoskeletal protein CcmA (bactofilin family)
MGWPFKKASGQVAVSAKGFSLGAEVGSSGEPSASILGGSSVGRDAEVDGGVSKVGTLARASVESQAELPQGGSDKRLTEEVAGLKAIPGAYVVPRGYRISGVAISHRPVVVRGELLGRGVSASELLVESSGVLRAPAEVETLRVFGRVVSSVRATSVVEVMAGGDIQGDLEAPGLSVAPGGRVSGGLLKVGADRSRQVVD